MRGLRSRVVGSIGLPLLGALLVIVVTFALPPYPPVLLLMAVLQLGIAVGMIRWEVGGTGRVGTATLISAVWLVLFVVKPVYLLWEGELRRSAFYMTVGAEEVMPFVIRGTQYSALFLALLFLVFSAVRRKGRAIRSPGPSSVLEAQVALTGAIVTLSAFVLWIGLNGGVSFVLSGIIEVADVRGGDLGSRLPVLGNALYPALYFLLAALGFSEVRDGRPWRTHLVVGVGLAVSYIHAGSVSAVVLFGFAAMIVLLQGSVQRLTRRRLLLLGGGLSLLGVAAVVLKVFLLASAVAEGDSGEVRASFVFFLREYALGNGFIHFILARFNSAEVLGLTIEAFDSRIDFYGPIFHLNGLTAFLPKSLLGLQEFSTGTLGNQWARDVVAIPVLGGMNPTVVGSFWVIFGPPSLVLGAVLLGALTAWVENWWDRGGHSPSELALYSTYLAFFVIFFFRTGGPVITMRRMSWIVIAYVVHKLVSVLLRGILGQRTRRSGATAMSVNHPLWGERETAEGRAATERSYLPAEGGWR